VVILVKASQGVKKHCLREASIRKNSLTATSCLPTHPTLQHKIKDTMHVSQNSNEHMSLHHALHLATPKPGPQDSSLYRVQCCTTTSSHPLLCSGDTKSSRDAAHHSYVWCSNTRAPFTGSPNLFGCTRMVHENAGGMLLKAWMAGISAPRGAADRVCTQYAALVPGFPGEKDYSAQICCVLGRSDTFLRCPALWSR
jgi:hypothetical protein